MVCVDLPTKRFTMRSIGVDLEHGAPRCGRDFNYTTVGTRLYVAGGQSVFYVPGSGIVPATLDAIWELDLDGSGGGGGGLAWRKLGVRLPVPLKEFSITASPVSISNWDSGPRFAGR